eukprot:366550-Chlamydomonas_euryale.AAC.12
MPPPLRPGERPVADSACGEATVLQLVDSGTRARVGGLQVWVTLAGTLHVTLALGYGARGGVKVAVWDWLCGVEIGGVRVSGWLLMG